MTVDQVTRSTPDQSGKRAVLYLRVSSDGQVKTDYDPEGISIPAQREACLRKAANLGVEAIGEYVEPGRSATSMDKRVAFQAMLARIRAERDVDHVIVYKLSRMNRNRVEDALVVDRLRRHGVSLISATEGIDDTRNGRLLHGILASINEFRSAEDGADIRDKMGYKARNGGTLGRAPLGYRNVRVEYEGRLVNTVALDADRAQLVRQAWELYATGEYSLDSLSAVMADRGLLTRATARWPSQPVSVNKLSQMLRDPYYLGKITYQGVLYDGRHDPIVDQALFDRVQKILDSRQQRGSRSRIHHHYLKGMLYCERCYQAGRTSRLVYSEGVSRNGTVYDYFKCVGRQQHLCDLPHIPVWQVERDIERTYRTLSLSEKFLTELSDHLEAALRDERQLTEEAHTTLRTQLARLDAKEEKLLDLAADNDLPTDKLKQRLRDITLERSRINQSLTDTSQELALGTAILRDSIELVRHPRQLYSSAPPDVRSQLNQTFYRQFFLEDHGQVRPVLAPPFDELHTAAQVYYRRSQRASFTEQLQPQTRLGEAETRQSEPTPVLQLADVFSDRGWNKRVMVELRVSEFLT